MSINTIKLATAEGDKYINPQQTLVYKNIELFGYGYLDWGTVVNQALVRLIDQIDNLQDSGLSELNFNLEEYEENQKVLRAEEFSTWKTGFRKILDELIQGYIDTTKESIDSFKESQNKINNEVSDLIKNNYDQLSGDIQDITSTLDEKIQNEVDAQLASVVDTVNKLTTKITQAASNLDQATQSVNQAVEEVRGLIDNFKIEFTKSFETFKVDTNKSLSDNKDYLIKYIDTKISGIGTTTNNLDERITNLELISDSLNPAYIQSLITTKVGQITAGVINTYLNDYNTRLSTLETNLSDLEKTIDKKIVEKINPTINSINTTIDNQNNSIKTLNDLVKEMVNVTAPPLTQMKFDIENEFGTVGKMSETIIDSEYFSLLLRALAIGGGNDYKVMFRNYSIKHLLQSKQNIQNIFNYTNANLLNLVEGLKHTPFDEMVLFKRQEAKANLINEYYMFAENNVQNYCSTEFKFSGLFLDYEKNRIDFAFSIPNIQNYDVWSTAQINITNVTSGEEIESIFMFSDGLISFDNLSSFNGLSVEEYCQLDRLNPFLYYLNLNTSGMVNATFLDNKFGENDNFRIVITTSNGVVADKTISINEFIKSGHFIESWLNNTYPTLYKNDLNIYNGEIDPVDITYSNNNNSRVIIPVNKIVTNTSGNKELSLKICLPTGATLTKLEINDEFTTSTKNFSNHAVLPLDELEYAARGLSSTYNYYNDIGSTGVLWFSINQDATTVKTIITYVVNGVTKTEEVTTAGSGNSKNKIVNATISSAAYYDIDVKTLFGASTDSVNISVEPRVQENTTTSELYGKYIKGDNLCTIAWIDSTIIRIYNEYNSSLTFQLLLRS